MEIPFTGETGVFCSSYSRETFVIDQKGRLLAFGPNEMGQLGVGDTNSRQIPTEVMGFEGCEVLMVCSGFEHTLILTKDDLNVFVCGSNKYGQLGVEEIRQTSTPKPLKFFADIDIIQVVAGEYSSYCLAADGRLFAFGWNANFQLGIGEEKYAKIPKLAEFPGDVHIVSVSAGWRHAAALTRDGYVYSFGILERGQAKKQGRHGLPEFIDQLGDKKVKAIVCGAFSIYAIVGINDIYVLGRNNFGELGIGHTRPQRTPERISFFEENPIKILSVGGVHVFAILESGDLVSFGSNQRGQIHTSEKSSRLPTKVPIKEGKLGNLVDVHCGYEHTIFTSDEGRCFGLGQHEAFSISKDITKPALVLENVQLPLYLRKLVPPTPKAALQRIQDYILAMNKVNSEEADFCITVEMCGEDSVIFRVDREFLRVRCPRLNLAAETVKTSEKISFEAEFTDRVAKTIMISLYGGTNETVRMLKIEEMIGLHCFLELSPLSDRLKKSCEQNIRGEVESSLKTAVDILLEAIRVNNEAIIDIALAEVTEKYSAAEDYLLRIGEDLPRKVSEMIAKKKPKNLPDPESPVYEEPTPIEALHMLYDEASKGISGDVSIKVGEKIYRAHRFILVSKSPFFRRVLKGQDSTCLYPLLSAELPQHLHSSFPLYVRYLYTGEVPLVPIDIVRLLPAVAFFVDEVNCGEEGIDEHDSVLLSLCEYGRDHIEVTLLNCVDLIIVSEEQKCEKNYQRAIEFAAANQRDIGNQLDVLDKDCIIKILKMACSLYVNEIDRLKARKLWRK